MERFNPTPIEGGVSLTMTPVLDMVVAEPLLGALRSAVGQGGNVEVDASQVERLSTACVQIIVAASRALSASGRNFSVSKYSDAFVAAFGDLGLYPSLMEWLTE
jgi:anti-anti-sigma regulatory factor